MPDWPGLTPAQQHVLDLQLAIDAIVEADAPHRVGEAIEAARKVANAVPHDGGLWPASSQHFIDTGRYFPKFTPDRPDVIVMLVEEDDDPDDPEYEAGQCVFVCPRCSAVNQWYEVDKSVRWNEVDVEVVLGPRGHRFTVLGVNQGDGDYETVFWKCQCCKGNADLPRALEFFDVSWG